MRSGFFSLLVYEEYPLLYPLHRRRLGGHLDPNRVCEKPSGKLAYLF